VAASVSRLQIRLNVDYYHMALQNEPLEHIAQTRAWIAHSHTSGPARHFPKADDGFDHRAFVGALRGIGFDAMMSFECSRVPAGVDYAAEARDGLAYVRQLWVEAGSAG
jgi:sugar phosphate isomerase/epimerase